MATAIEPEFLTRQEAAEFLHLRKQTLAAWACRGCGPKFTKLGKCVRYRRSELERWLAECTVQSTGEASHLS